MMHGTFYSKKAVSFRKCISGFVAFTFFFSLITFPATTAQAQYISNLPAPGTLVLPSTSFEAPLLRGLTLHPENPLLFDFIVDRGQDRLGGENLKSESQKLIKYFLAALTIPDDESWVNLSPYENDRIIPEYLAVTEMGKDMLEQDYLLKQLSASLTSPDTELGKKFWNTVYQKAYEKFGTTQIPISTFNKVWIVPDKAEIVEMDGFVFIGETHLKVMTQEDYTSIKENLTNKKIGNDRITADKVADLSTLSSEVVKSIIIPELEKEVNTGKNFTAVRQIYNSVVLAIWYKDTLKESLLGKVYVDKKKMGGVDGIDKVMKQKVYEQYLAAFRQGVYSLVKEDYDLSKKEVMPRKYFSGGVEMAAKVRAALVRRSVSDREMGAAQSALRQFQTSGEAARGNWEALDRGFQQNGVSAPAATVLRTFLMNGSEGELSGRFEILQVALEEKSAQPVVQEGAAKRAASAVQQTVSSSTVLLVDDSEDDLELARDAWQRRGFTVQTARNRTEAAGKLNDVDVVVTDKDMPGAGRIEDGWEFAQSHPEKKFIVVTGDSKFVETNGRQDASGRQLAELPNLMGVFDKGTSFDAAVERASDRVRVIAKWENMNTTLQQMITDSVANGANVPLARTPKRQWASLAVADAMSIILQNIKSGEPDPLVSFSLRKNSPDPLAGQTHTTPGKRKKVAMLAMNGNPSVWGHLVVLLYGIANLKADMGYLRIAGMGEVLAKLGGDFPSQLSEQDRLALLDGFIESFSPIVRSTDYISSKEGFAEMLDILTANAGDDVDLFYLISTEDTDRVYRYIRLHYLKLAEAIKSGKFNPAKHRFILGWLKRAGKVEDKLVGNIEDVEKIHKVVMAEFAQDLSDAQRKEQKDPSLSKDATQLMVDAGVLDQEARDLRAAKKTKEADEADSSAAKKRARALFLVTPTAELMQTLRQDADRLDKEAAANPAETRKLGGQAQAKRELAERYALSVDMLKIILDPSNRIENRYIDGQYIDGNVSSTMARASIESAGNTDFSTENDEMVQTAGIIPPQFAEYALRTGSLGAPKDEVRASFYAKYAVPAATGNHMKMAYLRDFARKVILDNGIAITSNQESTRILMDNPLNIFPIFIDSIEGLDADERRVITRELAYLDETEMTADKTARARYIKEMMVRIPAITDALEEIKGMTRLEFDAKYPKLSLVSSSSSAVKDAEAIIVKMDKGAVLGRIRWVQFQDPDSGEKTGISVPPAVRNDTSSWNDPDSKWRPWVIGLIQPTLTTPTADKPLTKTEAMDNYRKTALAELVLKNILSMPPEAQLIAQDPITAAERVLAYAKKDDLVRVATSRMTFKEGELQMFERDLDQRKNGEYRFFGFRSAVTAELRQNPALVQDLIALLSPTDQAAPGIEKKSTALTVIEGGKAAAASTSVAAGTQKETPALVGLETTIQSPGSVNYTITWKRDQPEGPVRIENVRKWNSDRQISEVVSTGGDFFTSDIFSMQLTRRDGKQVLVWEAFQKPITILGMGENRPVAAAVSSAPTEVGGIDFDPRMLNLQIKRNGKGVPLPLPQQNLEKINIDGLYPVIINTQPATIQSFPFLMGSNKQNEKVPDLSKR